MFVTCSAKSGKQMEVLGSAIETSDKIQNSAEIIWDLCILLKDYFYNGHQGAEVVKIGPSVQIKKTHVTSYHIIKTPMVKDFKSLAELRLK